ncbi:sigma factor [Streptomyces sp. NPDC102467]|uniref:sigma factor n=1 Tax=Streptomyces sp. NPDC102467 TaxID=3366179 RepID=UPI003801A414
MTDGPAAAPISEYARVYEAEQPRLVAYARSLTGSPWLADDLVAEAHFRVWRRLSAGHTIDNVAAYLTTTVRHLAATAGRGAARETPLDPHTGVEAAQVASGAYESAYGESAYGEGAYGDQDPASRVASVDLLTRVLGQLPERWVKALWLAEAEGQPLEAVGRRIGAGSGATAVLLHRAREGMRQAFLRAHPGTPEDPACEAHWDRMPAHVRDAASARQSEKLLAHVDTCDDCRARLAILLRANTRLPALVGPALLIFVLGGAGKFLLPLAAGAGAGVGGVSGAHGSGVLHGMRHVLAGGSKAPAAVAGVLGVSVAGAAVAAGLVLAGPEDAVPPPRSAAAIGDAHTERGGTPTPAPRAAQLPGPSTPPSDKPVAPKPQQGQEREQKQQRPTAPSAPKAPAQPSAPAKNQTRRPAAPATPTLPAQPKAPAAPPRPTTPEAPVTPEAPDTPSAPPSRARPATPGTGAPPSPTTPATPTTPTTPAETTDPGAPGPGEPTQPAQPTKPAEPTTPSEPTAPAEPTGPTGPTGPTATCAPWLGPIYICYVG